MAHFLIARKKLVSSTNCLFRPEMLVFQPTAKAMSAQTTSTSSRNSFQQSNHETIYRLAFRFSEYHKARVRWSKPRTKTCACNHQNPNLSTCTFSLYPHHNEVNLHKLLRLGCFTIDRLCLTPDGRVCLPPPFAISERSAGSTRRLGRPRQEIREL